MVPWLIRIACFKGVFLSWKDSFFLLGLPHRNQDQGFHLTTVGSLVPRLPISSKIGRFQLSHQTSFSDYWGVMYHLRLGTLRLQLPSFLLTGQVPRHWLLDIPVCKDEMSTSKVPACVASLWFLNSLYLTMATKYGTSFKNVLGDTDASLEIFCWSFKSCPRLTLTTC